MYRRLLHGRRVEWGVWAKITWLRRPNGWQKFTMPLGSRVRSPSGGVRSAFLFIFKRHNIRPSLRLGAWSERASSRSPHPTPLSTQQRVRKSPLPPSLPPFNPLLFALPQPSKGETPSVLLTWRTDIPSSSRRSLRIVHRLIMVQWTGMRGVLLGALAFLAMVLPASSLYEDQVGLSVDLTLEFMGRGSWGGFERQFPRGCPGTLGAQGAQCPRRALHGLSIGASSC